MPVSNLANQLIDADVPARTRILSGIPMARAEHIASEIRKICIEVFSSDPARVQRAAGALVSLAKTFRSDVTAANRDWAAGIANITRGKFDAAVKALDSAISVFSKLGRRPETAQIQVSKLLALAMLSRYDEAIATGLAAIPVLVKSGDELAAGKIEMNLSNIVSRRGLHREAEGFCASARRRFIRSGAASWQAMAENGLANTYAELNDFKQAEQFYEKARTTALAVGMSVTEAEIDASLGNLALFRGRYADALRYLEISRRKFESLDMPHQTAIADLEIADIYAELNLNAEAIEIYEKVCEAFRRLKLRAEEARARLNYGRAARVVGALHVAKRQLATALRLFAAEKNAAGQASSMLEQARLFLDTGDSAEALSTATKAETLLRRSQNMRLGLTAGLLAGQAYRALGNRRRARNAFERVAAEAKRLAQPDAEQMSYTSLAMIDTAENNISAAEAGFKRAIRIVERLRAPLASEEFGMAFLAARLEPYDQLARLYLASGRVAAAFRAVENGRSRSLVDALSRNSTDDAETDVLTIELARVREELNSYYKRLDRADDDEIDTLQAAVRQREAAVARLTRRIASVAVGVTADRGASSNKALHRQLGSATTLIEYVEFDGEISAFVVCRGKIRIVRDITTTDDLNALLEDLHFHFGSLRYGSTGIERFLPQMKTRTDACLRELYDRLIKPLEPHIHGEKLVIVPAGPLHYVPFHALYDGQAYMVERFDTVYAPSAGVWSKLQEKPRRKIESSLLMAFADERIPLVENEVRVVGRTVPGPKVFTGRKASFAAFVRQAPLHDLIHLACHGQFRAENPMFSSLHLADGWVTVRDICSQRIGAELVTLSACETGLNKLYAGDEILGLARGFLTAGVSSLVVSLWTVNDAAASRLMNNFYSEIQRGRSVAASLRQAQLCSIRNGEHPFWWSPFVLIGR